MNIKRTSIILLFILSLWLVMPVEEENKDSFSEQTQKTLTDEELIYVIPHQSDTLDPAKALNDSSSLIISNIFEGLVKFNPQKNKIEPSLATNWKTSQDGLEWTFNLRKGVEFHDGTSFNAQAVKFSIMRQLQKNPDMPYGDFVYGPVEEIDIVDNHTIKFKLKYPYTPFLKNLAMPFAAPVVSPSTLQKHESDFEQYASGTGPFKLDSWKKDSVVLKKNSSYWGNTPNIDSIKFLSIPQEEKRLKMLSEGKAHIISDISPHYAKSLQEEGYKTYSVSGLDINYLGFYMNKSSFSHLKARKAVKFAIDNKEIVQDVMDGKGVPAKAFLPPYMQIESPNDYSQNIKKAKELLSEVPQEKEIKLITYTGTRPYNPAGGKNLAKAIANELQKIGFDVTIKSYNWEEYKKAINRQEGDIFLYGWTGDNGDPDNFLYPLFSSVHIDTGLNVFHFQNKELDALLATAQKTQNASLRKELYRRCLKILYEETPSIPINHSKKIYVSSREVSNFSPHFADWNRLRSIKLH